MPKFYDQDSDEAKAEAYAFSPKAEAEAESLMHESIEPDAIMQELKEEVNFALWDLDYAEWPWQWYPEEALGD